jgi:hypothetical protein
VEPNESWTPINKGVAVLIAIIVSLISLLPLAFSLAQKRDKQIKDLSNARQIVLALKNISKQRAWCGLHGCGRSYQRQ